MAEAVIAVCKICQELKPGWYPGWEHHWGFTHVCKKCVDACQKWCAWDENELIAAFPNNAVAVSIAFKFTNRLRKRENARRRDRRSKTIESGRKIEKSRHRRYRPLLRRSFMKNLGYTV